MGDIFSSPYTIIIIMIAVIAILSLLVKSEKAKRVGVLCGWIIVLFIYFILIDNAIMPATGYAPDSANYQSLRAILCIIPFLIMLKRKI